MANQGRPPTTPTTSAQQQRQQSTGNHSSSSASTTSPLSNTPPQRQTTFLTKDPNRAASAYHVDTSGGSIGNSQRARQDHANGPKVMTPMKATHAFTSSHKNNAAVANVTEKMSQEKGISPQAALRLNVMDGLAKVKATQGANHIEAFGAPTGRGNPHISGGTVTFPLKGGGLSNFDAVASNTQTMRAQKDSTHKTATPVTGGTTSDSSSAQQFNAANLQTQQSFAKRILNSTKK